MIVYQETKRNFLNDVRLDLIEEKIEQKVLERLHKKTAHNELYRQFSLILFALLYLLSYPLHRKDMYILCNA